MYKHSFHCQPSFAPKLPILKMSCSLKVPLNLAKPRIFGNCDVTALKLLPLLSGGEMQTTTQNKLGIRLVTSANDQPAVFTHQLTATQARNLNDRKCCQTFPATIPSETSCEAFRTLFYWVTVVSPHHRGDCGPGGWEGSPAILFKWPFTLKPHIFEIALGKCRV